LKERSCSSRSEARAVPAKAGILACRSSRQEISERIDLQLRDSAGLTPDFPRLIALCSCPTSICRPRTLQPCPDYCASSVGMQIENVPQTHGSTTARAITYPPLPRCKSAGDWRHRRHRCSDLRRSGLRGLGPDPDPEPGPGRGADAHGRGYPRELYPSRRIKISSSDPITTRVRLSRIRLSRGSARVSEGGRGS